MCGNVDIGFRLANLFEGEPITNKLVLIKPLSEAVLVTKMHATLALICIILQTSVTVPSARPEEHGRLLKDRLGEGKCILFKEKADSFRIPLALLHK